MRGAGGTQGGIGEFLIGFAMMSGGVYLLLQSVQVTSGFALGYGIWRWGDFSVTGGMILIPFIFGVGMIFWNAKNMLGWFLAGGSLVALVFGVLASIQFHMRRMTLFELITILILAVGGAAFFFRGLRESPTKKPPEPANQ